MRSAEAEEGCTKRTFFAASAQAGRVVSWFFQKSKGLYSELTSSAAAMYWGNSFFKAVKAGGWKNGNAERLSTSLQLGLISCSLRGENRHAALKALRGLLIASAAKC